MVGSLVQYRTRTRITTGTEYVQGLHDALILAGIYVSSMTKRAEFTQELVDGGVTPQDVVDLYRYYRRQFTDERSVAGLIVNAIRAKDDLPRLLKDVRQHLDSNDGPQDRYFGQSYWAHAGRYDDETSNDNIAYCRVVTERASVDTVAKEMSTTVEQVRKWVANEQARRNRTTPKPERQIRLPQDPPEELERRKQVLADALQQRHQKVRRLPQ